MNQREREILKVEKDIKDTLENELIKYQSEDKKLRIVDIKLVGQIAWKDKINGKTLTENVFLVEKETVESDDKGHERIIGSKSYYLGDKCIAGLMGEEIIYKESFKNFEQDKMIAVNDLLDRTDEQDIESNSLNILQRKELAEVLTAYLGKEVLEKDVEKVLEELNEDEIEELRDEKENQENKDEKNLSKKQSEKIKVNGVQKADLNKLVDGKETLGQRLDLQEYDSLYVVYSDKVNEITTGAKINNTTYSLVGMTKDGDARVLNDEFEMDKTVGNNASREQTKIRANNVATRDNKDVSVYTRKSNGMSIGCENNQGNVNMFLYQKTLEENENVGIQIETSKTPIIQIETRDVLSRNKGIYQKERVQDEIEKHTEDGCKPENVKDFDGNVDTSTHEHLLEKNLDNYVIEIFNYENDFGEEKIKEVFTQEEIRDKLIRELKENKDKISIEQIVKNVKDEMNEDAEIFTREHKL